MADRITVSTVQRDVAAPLDRATFYASNMLPFEQKRFELSYQDALNQIKNDQEKQAFRQQYLQTLDAQISQAQQIKAAYLSQYNSALDDTQKTAIQQKYDEQMKRFESGVNIDLSNAATGRTIAAGIIDANSRIASAEISAGAREAAGQNEILKQRIQERAQAEANGSLKNDIQTSDKIFSNIYAGQVNQDTFDALGNAVQQTLMNASNNREPLPLNSWAKQIATEKDPVLRQQAFQAVSGMLRPEDQNDLRQRVAALTDRLTLSGGGGTTIIKSPGGGYLSADKISGQALPEATGGEMEAGQNRANFISEQMVPEINNINSLQNALQLRRDQVYDAAMRYQPQNATQLAQQYMGANFGSTPISRRATATPTPPNPPEQLSPLGVPYRVEVVPPAEAPAAPPTRQALAVHALHQAMTKKSSPPPAPPVHMAHTTDHPPDQIHPDVVQQLLQAMPLQIDQRTTQHLPGTPSIEPPQINAPPLYGSQVDQRTVPVVIPESPMTYTRASRPFERYAPPPPEQHFQGIPGLNPVPQIQRESAPIQVKPATPDSFKRIPPPGAQTPAPPPDLKSETGDTGSQASTGPKLKPMVQAALEQSHSYQSQPNRVQRLLANDDVSKVAATAYQVNKRNGKSFQNTLETVMASFDGDPESQQKALSILFYLSNRDNSAGKVPSGDIKVG